MKPTVQDLCDPAWHPLDTPKQITNARTLELDAGRMKDRSLDYTRQAEALPEGRTQDVCHTVALYLKLASDALGLESAQLRKYEGGESE